MWMPDVLVVQGLTAFKADANGNVLDEVAGTISRVEANGVLTGISSHRDGLQRQRCSEVHRC